MHSCRQVHLHLRVDRSRFYRWLKPRLAAAARPTLLPSSRWLAEQVESNQLLRELEGGRTPQGAYAVKHIPQEPAAETLAEGQFNRFYMLGLAKRARAEGLSDLEVYRARDTSSPRAESEAMIGNRIPVDEVEDQLRDTKASLKSPLLQIRSGISLKLPGGEEPPRS